MGKQRKGVKRRSSIITIVIVLILFAVGCYLTTIFAQKKEQENEKKERLEQKVYTNVDEVDFMINEYSSINSELNGLYAFGIKEDKVVGVISDTQTVDIISIDTNYTYDYLYNSAKMYLLQKETGIISVVSLKGEYSVVETIELNEQVDDFDIYNNEIIYLSNGSLKKQNGDVILDKIESKEFVIKFDKIYVVKDKALKEYDFELNEREIAANVLDIDYYIYAERDRLVFESSADGQNTFKNLFNFYNGEIINSVKNETYFVPFEAKCYVYLSNDRTSINFITQDGINKMLKKSKEKINNIFLVKEGYIVAETDENTIIINLETREEVEYDIIRINNIRYLK